MFDVAQGLLWDLKAVRKICWKEEKFTKNKKQDNVPHIEQLKQREKFIMRIISIHKMKIENGEDLVRGASLIIMEE